MSLNRDFDNRLIDYRATETETWQRMTTSLDQLIQTLSQVLEPRTGSLPNLCGEILTANRAVRVEITAEATTVSSLKEKLPKIISLIDRIKTIRGDFSNHLKPDHSLILQLLEVECELDQFFTETCEALITKLAEEMMAAFENGQTFTFRGLEILPGEQKSILVKQTLPIALENKIRFDALRKFYNSHFGAATYLPLLRINHSFTLTEYFQILVDTEDESLPYALYIQKYSPAEFNTFYSENVSPIPNKDGYLQRVIGRTIDRILETNLLDIPETEAGELELEKIKEYVARNGGLFVALFENEELNENGTNWLAGISAVLNHILLLPEIQQWYTDLELDSPTEQIAAGRAVYEKRKQVLAALRSELQLFFMDEVLSTIKPIIENQRQPKLDVIKDLRFLLFSEEMSWLRNIAALVIGGLILSGTIHACGTYQDHLRNQESIMASNHLPKEPTQFRKIPNSVRDRVQKVLEDEIYSAPTVTTTEESGTTSDIIKKMSIYDLTKYKANSSETISDTFDVYAFDIAIELGPNQFTSYRVMLPGSNFSDDEIAALEKVLNKKK